MRALVEVTSTLRERSQKWQNYQNCAGSGFGQWLVITN